MQLFRWRRWWSARGLSELRVMAIEHWDPMNYYDDAAHADAYDPYLNRVGRMLRRGKGAEEIAIYLGKVRTLAFRRSENETVDEQFAARVIAWYLLEAPTATQDRTAT
jgi:hypothetical protein